MPNEEQTSQVVVFLKQLVSGGGAGAISKTAVAPAERIKTLLQANSFCDSNPVTDRCCTVGAIIGREQAGWT